MTTAEATIYLPKSSDESLEEALENKLFEFKMFFLQKTILDKIFKSRLEKLKRIEQAYSILSKKELKTPTKHQCNLIEDNEIITVYNDFHSKLNKIKLWINEANCTTQLIYTIEKLLMLHNQYLEKWPETEYSDEVIISKEKDPMELFYAIQTFRQNGGIHFQDIIKKQNICPEILLNETKRLSLCRNLNKNE